MIDHVPVTQPLSTCGHSSSMSNPTHFPHPCYFQIPGIILSHFTCILHVALKEMYKVYLTCLVVILFTIVDVFIRNIVFPYITYFISATCLSLSLSLIICSAFRKLYVFVLIDTLYQDLRVLPLVPTLFFIIAYRFPTMSNSHNKISSFPSFTPLQFPIPRS